ncbi:unnamed protein product [Ascophyllum nodosum]
MCKTDKKCWRTTTLLLHHGPRLMAAVAMCALNSLFLLCFLLPPVTLWLAWKFPYVIIPPGIAYYILSYDGAELKEGRPWRTFVEKSWVFRLARAYHDMQLHLHPELNPSKMTGEEQFLFALHPHGALSDYRVLMDGVIGEHFPKLRSWRVLAASVLFKLPFVRELCLWSHCIDASRKTAEHALSRGHSLFVVPGGEHEQILGGFGKEVLYLKKRMGFIKLALRNRIPVVPVYIFGANDTFYTSSLLQRERLTLVKRLRVAVPLFWGRFGLPIPREVHFRIVFGAPLRFASETETDSDSRVSVDKDGLKEVSDEQLIEAHGAYVDALKQLFDENKTRFGYADRELCVM